MEEIKSYLTTRALPWVKGLINNWNPMRGALQRITLRHLRSDGSPSSDVTSSNIPAYTGPQDVPGPDEIESVVDELVTAAMNDAEGLGSGLQRYGLFAFFEKEPMAPLRHPMKVQGGGMAARSGDEFGLGSVEDSETPDARGIVAQHMRHTEAMMKSTVLMSTSNQRIAIEQNQMLANQVTVLTRQVFSLLESQQRVLDNQTARQIAEKKSQVWIENLEGFADMLKVLLPHAVNKISGKEILPTRSTAGEMELVALMQTLRPEQLKALQSTLKPEQMLAIMSIMDRAMAAAPQRSITAEADAAVAAAGPLKEYKVIAGSAPHIEMVLKEMAFEVQLVDHETIKTDAGEKQIRALEAKIRSAVARPQA